MEIIKLDGKYSLSGLIPVENYNKVLNFICDDIHKSIRLTSYLKDVLTKLFGKYNQTYKGEFFYYIWVLKFGDDVFQICTAKDKGTSINILGKLTDNKTNICIEFLTKFDEIININNDRNG